MGLNDLWWVFFAFIALQPVIRQKVLEASRLRALRRIEKARGSRVISLVHRQETMSFLGFPLMRYIDVNDSEDVLRAIELTDADLPIDLIVHTPGGLVPWPPLRSPRRSSVTGARSPSSCRTTRCRAGRSWPWRWTRS
jgi:ClpP class serine protease